MNVFVLLFLTLFLLQQSSVQAPLEPDGTEADVSARTHAAILSLFIEADLGRCKGEEFMGDETSVFERPDSPCKVFFASTNGFLKELDRRGGRMPLTALKGYFVGVEEVEVKRKFNFVTVTFAQVSVLACSFSRRFL